MYMFQCNLCDALLMQNDLLQLFPSQKLEIENHKLCATVKTNYGVSCNLTSAPRQPWRQSPHVIWNNGSPYLPSSPCPAPPLPCPQSVQSHLYPASTSRASYPQQNYWSFYFAKMLLLGFRFNWILRLVRNQLDISRNKFFYVLKGLEFNNRHL